MPEPASSEHCAHVMLKVVPQVMQAIRAEVRRQRGQDLSVLQLRALAFLHGRPGAPLTALAEHVGLTLPSMSSQVSGLVARDLIDRAVSPEDRRYVTLRLTPKGRAVFQSAFRQAEQQLAQRLEALSPEARGAIVEAMMYLSSVFSPESALLSTTTETSSTHAP